MLDACLPVLIEPVIDVDLEVDVITEVTGTRGGHEVSRLILDEMAFMQLLAESLVVLAENTKRAS